MSNDEPRRGKVVVNRAISVDGYIAAPDHSMDFGDGRLPPDFVPRSEIQRAAARTGAMLIGRRTSDVGSRMAAENPGTVDYPFMGSAFLLTHRPPDPPIEGLTVLSGDIAEAVETALEAANGRDLELLGADVAAQAFARRLVDEVLIYVLPVVLGGGIPFSPPGSARIDLEPIETRQAGDVTILRFRVRK